MKDGNLVFPWAFAIFLAVLSLTPTLTQGRSSSTAFQSETIESKQARAQQLEEEGKTTAIVQLLKGESDRLSRKGLILLARAYRHLKDSQNETLTLELLVSKNANDFHAKNLLARAYSENQRIEESIRLYREARQLNPRYFPTYEGLLDVLEKSNENYEARVLINEMLARFAKRKELDKALPRLYTSLCRLFALDAFLDKAAETCRIAIGHNDKSYENFLYLGLSLKDKGEDSQALKVFTNGLKKFPESDALLVSTAEVQARQKNVLAAYKLYKKAVSLKKTSADAQIGLANSAFDLEKYEEALAAYIKSCSFDRKLKKDFRAAHGKLRERKTSSWEAKYEKALEECG